MPTSPAADRELQILEQIEANPDATQAGYIRAKQLQRRRLQYIITPAGIALRSKLAVDSLQYSMSLYRETRRQAKQLILEARQRGWGAVAILGKDDLAEIARLTCLDLDMPIKPAGAKVPHIVACGTTLKWEEGFEAGRN
jgi:hypothetical protein